MSVTKLPGFFDYLGQGIQQFGENLQRRQTDELNRKYDTLRFLANEHNAGNLPTDSFKAWLSQNKIPGLDKFEPGPSMTEQRQQYISTLEPSEQEPARASMLGFKPPGEYELDRRAKVAGARSAEAGATSAEVAAAHADENAQNASALAKLNLGDETAKQYARLGEQYIGAATMGQRLDPRAGKQIVDAAVNKYMRDRQMSRAGVIPDSEIPVLRAHFENAFTAAMLKQRELDIRERAASNRQDPEDKLQQRLITLRGGVASRAEQLLAQLSGPGAIAFKSTNPTLFASLSKQYEQEISKAYALDKAIATLDQGDIKKALIAAGQEQIPTPGGPVTSGGTTTPPQTVMPGVTSQVKTPATTVPAFTKEQYSQAKSMVEQLPKENRKEYLDRKLQMGTLNKADYDRLVKELKL